MTLTQVKSGVLRVVRWLRGRRTIADAVELVRSADLPAPTTHKPRYTVAAFAAGGCGRIAGVYTARGVGIGICGWGRCSAGDEAANTNAGYASLIRRTLVVVGAALGLAGGGPRNYAQGDSAKTACERDQQPAAGSCCRHRAGNILEVFGFQVTPLTILGSWIEPSQSAGIDPEIPAARA
jgi:hypothetical protein